MQELSPPVINDVKAEQLTGQEIETGKEIHRAHALFERTGELFPGQVVLFPLFAFRSIRKKQFHIFGHRTAADLESEIFQFAAKAINAETGVLLENLVDGVNDFLSGRPASRSLFQSESPANSFSGLSDPAFKRPDFPIHLANPVANRGGFHDDDIVFPVSNATQEKDQPHSVEKTGSGRAFSREREY